MIRYAFSLMELVFVIVIVGIVSAAVIPRFERDSLYEMAEQVSAHIRYTQHLAMSDNIYMDDRSRWFQARWQIGFVNGPCGLYYRVGSDRDLSSGNGRFSNAEAARDPLTRTLIYNNNTPCSYRDGWHKGVLLTQKYDITTMSSSCNTQTIAFDHIGRPYTGVGGTSATDGLMREDCHYTFTHAGGSSVRITVTAETGYVYITYIE